MTVNHTLSIQQFDRAKIDSLFTSARQMKFSLESGNKLTNLAGKVSANLFYEPSTRTSSSFAAAMYRLGGNVIAINDVQYSSVAKGETLEDTIRTLEQYADCIVLRHAEIGSAAKAASVSSVPIINAGDGVGEHPTQALLDLFTIYEEQGSIDGLTITMVGDLKNGRTVHSLARLLNLYEVTINFVSPKELQFPHDKDHSVNNPYHEHDSLDGFVKDTDVLYVTRVQKERFTDLNQYEEVKDYYKITPDTLKPMKKTASVMHPLPRVGEISFEVDDDPRAAYFRQMKNGLYVRMALLDHVLSGSDTKS